MKKLFVLFLLFVISSQFVLAQTNTAIITGKIIQSGQPAAGASVELQAENGKVVGKTSANAEGLYRLENKQPGKYLLKITAVGSTPITNTIQVLAGENPQEDATLALAAKDLGAVVVQSQRKPIEIRADKTVINVDASPSNAGANALEVLEKSPGVMVDQDGNISLSGKKGVNVTIDGKPSQMSGADLANYLRSLPADQLDQVELITQPSAKYDAEGNAGIINLKFKRNKLKGFNGNAGSNYSQGKYSRINNNLFAGYRNGKWNLYLNLSGGKNTVANSVDVLRYFRIKGSNELTSIFDQSTNLKSQALNSNISFDVDYLLTKKTTLGVKLKNSINNNDFTLPTLMKIYNADHEFTGQANTIGKNKLSNTNLTVNTNLKIALDSQGTTLTADADYARFFSDSKQTLYNYFYNVDGSESAPAYLLKGTNPSLFNIYSAKIDYSHPLPGKMNIEAGLKTSFVESDNNSSFFNKNSGNWETDARSNYFIYRENINAAYASVSKNFDKLQVQAGLRVENTNAIGDQRMTNEKFKRNYTQLFPTAFASYKFSSDHSANLNVGRRIRRPDYDALNPFQLLLNPYTYQQGNPLLQPQFSNNAELGYIFKNGLFNAKLSLSETKNIISDVLTQDEATTVSFVRPENLASQEDIQLQLGSNLKLEKWWTVNASGAVNYLHFKGLLSGYDHDVTNTTFSINLTNQFKFDHGWSAEISGFYRYRNLFSGNSVVMPWRQMNAGITRDILKKKATLKLSARDILNTTKFRIDQNYHEFESYFTNKPSSRTISLGFTWRFSKNAKNVLQQRNTGASADEQNRTGKN